MAAHKVSSSQAGTSCAYSFSISTVENTVCRTTHSNSLVKILSFISLDVSRLYHARFVSFCQRFLQRLSFEWFSTDFISRRAGSRKESQLFVRLKLVDLFLMRLQETAGSNSKAFTGENMIESGRKNHDESRFNDNKKQKWKMRMLGRSESDRAWAGHEYEEN